MPKSNVMLCDILPAEEIDLLLSQNCLDLLACPVDPALYELMLSSLSPDLVIQKSNLSEKLLILGTLEFD